MGNGSAWDGSDALPNTIRRYGRLKICAAIQTLSHVKHRPGFTAGKMPATTQIGYRERAAQMEENAPVRRDVKRLQNHALPRSVPTQENAGGTKSNKMTDGC